MKTKPTLFIGSLLVGDEAVFLRRLYADVADANAVILANFVVGDRQIDFLVITATSAGLLELKTYRRPVFGSLNGEWTVRDAAGNVVPDIRFNPYQQTLQEAFQLSNAMKRYAQLNRGTLAAPKRAHYEFFRSYVCIFPELHPDSRATRGDRKVRVYSYSDVLAALRMDTIQPGWNQDQWIAFAENYLRLKRVSLEAAIDPRVLQTQGYLTAYRQRAVALLRDGLAPLLPAGDGVLSGTALIAHLHGTNNYLVHGPSGSAKTFHLHHLTLELMARGTEHPLLLEAKRYRGGDFWPYLRQSVAPFYRGDLKSLFVALNDAGIKPVLLIDALNECTSHSGELLRGAAAFALHYDARLVITTQLPPTATAGIAFESFELSLPDGAQKRAIYAFHAGISPDPELDVLCSGFENAYDLVLAGRCHASGVPPSVRADLYDRYLTLSLPEGDAFVASALLRHLAGHMREQYAIALSRRTFEDMAGQFLSQHDAKLSLLDRLAATRLVNISPDTFSFEHELLLTYLQADDLCRQSSNVNLLAEQLAKPGSTNLFEFVLPRMTDDGERLRLLNVVRDVGVLRAVLRGTYGSAAQGTLHRALDGFLNKAISDLGSIIVKIETTAHDDTRRIEFVHLRSNAALSDFERQLATLLADAILDPVLQSKAFTLLDATEQTLRTAVSATATKVGVGQRYAWSEAMRIYGGVMQISGTMLPASTMLVELLGRSHLLYRDLLSTEFYSHLLERATASPRSDFALNLLLEDHAFMSSSDLISEKLDLIDAAWQSKLSPLRTSALFAFPFMRCGLDAEPELKDRAITMLDSYLGNNPFVNGLIFEAKSILEAMPLPVSPDEARDEARIIVAAHSEDTAGLAELAEMIQSSLEEVITERAYRFIGNIFEDIYQGVYYDAYREMVLGDRLVLLTQAAKYRTGFYREWIFDELLQANDSAAVAVFEEALGTVNFESSFQQDEVAAAITAIQGCARWLSVPPLFGASPVWYGKAFGVIGAMLFWTYRGELTPERRAELNAQCAGLDGDARLAAGAIFVALDRARWVVVPTERDKRPKLEEIFPDAIEEVALECIRRRGDFAVVHQRHNFRGEAIIFLITTLGTIGSPAAISALKELADDSVLGETTVRALHELQRRGVGVV